MPKLKPNSRPSPYFMSLTKKRPVSYALCLSCWYMCSSGPSISLKLAKFFAKLAASASRWMCGKRLRSACASVVTLQCLSNPLWLRAEQAVLPSSTRGYSGEWQLERAQLKSRFQSQFQFSFSRSFALPNCYPPTYWKNALRGPFNRNKWDYWGGIRALQARLWAPELGAVSTQLIAHDAGGWWQRRRSGSCQGSSISPVRVLVLFCQQPPRQRAWWRWQWKWKKSSE